jgi:hypothetical protein
MPAQHPAQTLVLTADRQMHPALGFKPQRRLPCRSRDRLGHRPKANNRVFFSFSVR